MKKYILVMFVISLMLATSSSFAMGFPRDSLDHVEIITAVKSELCIIENPGCDEPQGDEPIIENTSSALPWDVRFNLSAECLRAKIEELSCQPERAEMILGEFKIFVKTDKEGGRLYSGGIVMVIDNNVYGPGMMTAGYYPNTSKGGWFVMDDPDHPEKFKGLKHLAFSQPNIFDPDIPPSGSERVSPGFILIYYDEDGTLSIYAHLKEKIYKMTNITKKIENKTWSPPPEPEKPGDVPPKDEIETPIPPPPVYLPGMPDTADPNKTHVIPNCNSQGASVCKYDEECPDDKWIKAKEDKCCSIICTPVGRERAPGQEKNKTEGNTTGQNEINETS